MSGPEPEVLVRVEGVYKHFPI
ncbi:MAG: hypothetical protein QOE54_6981, partial [Streptosporangiaceae bacterium]|nr:hypothetical protein [Streptosporangiaceae bacterium]